MKKWYLYHIRFEHNKTDEIFDKIGITSRSVQERFGISNYLNYSLKIKTIKKLPKDECKEMEKRLLAEYREISYIPLDENFSGKTECFYPDLINIEHIIS
jgi:hypothetical protein